MGSIAWPRNISVPLILMSQVVGVLLAVLFGYRHETHAACFKGSFLNDSWSPSGCRLPEPSYAARKCLAGRNLLFMGDSTIRNLYQTICGYLKVDIHRHPCDMRMGWGCHDCLHGCRDASFIANNDLDWHDAHATTATGTQLTFTWKPEMFTTDDFMFLKSFTRTKDGLVDAVIVHKGIHEAWSLQNELKPRNYTEHQLALEIGARAEVLAETLRSSFPGAELFWKDAYYNGKDVELEGINSRLGLPIQATFRQQGFHVLPGHHVSKSANDHYSETDGIHPHHSVDDVMISMIADILCH